MTTLSANIDSSQTLIPISGPLVNGEFTLPLYYTINSEALRVTGRAHRTTWLAERGIAGTTAASHTSGATLTRYYPDAATAGGAGSGVPDPSEADDGDVINVQAGEYALSPSSDLQKIRLYRQIIQFGDVVDDQFDAVLASLTDGTDILDMTCRVKTPFAGPGLTQADVTFYANFLEALATFRVDDVVNAPETVTQGVALQASMASGAFINHQHSTVVSGDPETAASGGGLRFNPGGGTYVLPIPVVAAMDMYVYLSCDNTPTSGHIEMKMLVAEPA